jgi:hypothetical protein
VSVDTTISTEPTASRSSKHLGDSGGLRAGRSSELLSGVLVGRRTTYLRRPPCSRATFRGCVNVADGPGNEERDVAIMFPRNFDATAQGCALVQFPMLPDSHSLALCARESRVTSLSVM